MGEFLFQPEQLNVSNRVGNKEDQHCADCNPSGQLVHFGTAQLADLPNQAQIFQQVGYRRIFSEHTRSVKRPKADNPAQKRYAENHTLMDGKETDNDTLLNKLMERYLETEE